MDSDSNTTYTVQSGDTLWGIAQNNGISLSQLEALNPQITNPDLITPGETVNLSGGAVATTDSTSSASGTYTVQSGDTLWGIAQNNGISLSQLEALNPQITNPDLITPGETVNLGGAAAAPTTTASAPAPESVVSAATTDTTNDDVSSATDSGATATTNTDPATASDSTAAATTATDPTTGSSTGLNLGTSSSPASASTATDPTTDPTTTDPTAAATTTAAAPVSEDDPDYSQVIEVLRGGAPDNNSAAGVAGSVQAVETGIAIGADYNPNQTLPTGGNGNTATMDPTAIAALNSLADPSTDTIALEAYNNADLSPSESYYVGQDNANGTFTAAGNNVEGAQTNPSDPYQFGSYSSAQMEAMGFTLATNEGGNVFWVGPLNLWQTNQMADPGAGWIAMPQPGATGGGSSSAALQIGVPTTLPSGATATAENTTTSSGAPDVTITGTTASGAGYTSIVVDPPGTQLQTITGYGGVPTEIPTTMTPNTNDPALNVPFAITATGGALRSLKDTGSALLRPAFLKKSHYNVAQSANKLHTSSSGTSAGGGQAIAPASDPVMGAVVDKPGEKPTTSDIKH